jgi:hypothetical protein
VRIIINYVSIIPSVGGINMSWAGVSISEAYVKAFGRNLAISGGLLAAGPGSTLSVYAQNMVSLDQYEQTNSALPTEIMLAPGQTFSITSSVGINAYNIVIIPEAG